MKPLLRWFGDPCVHLVLVGLAILHLSMNLQTDSDYGNEDAMMCNRCDRLHSVRSACPAIATVADHDRSLE
ncbi:hypothetical protein [Singulisphaera acidiphila]|uniref:Uncharacterized protein n=1 Tax=Singulisphaera acidiphila (strain ATCC BAA-1392 / DSM 18658 / VKM B-2454 / MOB10) TaxID=886293 RepID=L0DMW0_SINAD|nr:hypothetical protein [Singulisphaera acidiphila]AGA30587.1 hypothetical protein Sinac_6511 [Singulisphaera acidiphila DSM 18658]